MTTECTPIPMEFQGVGRRKVEASFDGGHLSSDGGTLLLREAEERFTIIERFPACFTDHRDPRYVEHSVLAEHRDRLLIKEMTDFSRRLHRNKKAHGRGWPYASPIQPISIRRYAPSIAA